MNWRHYSILLSITVSLVLGVFTVLPILAQGANNQAVEKQEAKKTEIDPAKTCQAEPPAGKSDRSLTTVEIPEGVPLETQSYLQAMEKLLKESVENLEKEAREVASKRKILAKLRNLEGSYHEVQLENVAGYWHQGSYQSLRKSVSFTFNESGDINCMVLDRIEREIDYPENWTRKIVRIRYPDLNSIELEAHREGYDSLDYLVNMDMDVRKKAIDLIYAVIKNTGYTMDIQIAAARSRQNNIAEWKVDM